MSHGSKDYNTVTFPKKNKINLFGFIILKGLKGICKRYSDFNVKRSNSPFNCLGLENINLDFIVKVFLNTLASKLAKSEGITEGKHKTAKKETIYRQLLQLWSVVRGLVRVMFKIKP